MQVPLSERESDQITHAPDIIVVRLFNVMLFETEMKTLSVLWVGSVHARTMVTRVPDLVESGQHH